MTTWNGRLPDEPITFIGIEAPEDLPDGSEAYTLDRLGELIRTSGPPRTRRI